MGYKLKELPENAYWQETKQFTIVDDEGKEIEIRVTESSKFYERFMWHEPGGWDEIDNDEINEYLDEQFSDDEWAFEQQAEEEMHKKMDAVYDKFVEENGEVDDFMKFNNLINEVNRETDYKKEYGKRFYDSYQYVFKKLRDKE
jgi:hypothetical protein